MLRLAESSTGTSSLVNVADLQNGHMQVVTAGMLSRWWQMQKQVARELRRPCLMQLPWQQPWMLRVPSFVQILWRCALTITCFTMLINGKLPAHARGLSSTLSQQVLNLITRAIVAP